MWTPEESSMVVSEARNINPEVKTLVLPQGLQLEKGPDAVVEYIKEQLPALIERWVAFASLLKWMENSSLQNIGFMIEREFPIRNVNRSEVNTNIAKIW